MNKKEDKSRNKNIYEGYIPVKKSYQPNSGSDIGGYKPAEAKINPVNPPKKK